MDKSLYHAFYELEDRHWWFVGRRRIVDALLGRFLGRGGAGPARGSSRDAAGSGAAGDASGGDAPPLRILDVGCGTGGMLPVLARHGQVTGIDMEPLALDYCRRRGITDVHLQESFEAPAAFDVVTLFDVLEHVENEAGFLARVGGWLKPGGLLLVTVPAFQFLWSPHDDLNRHRRRYTRPRLIRVLESAGFTVRQSSYFNMFLFPAAAVVRLLAGRGNGRRESGQSAAATAGEAPIARSAGDDQAVLDQLRLGGSNRFLAGIFGGERHLLRLMNLPFGVSLYAAARKRSPGAGSA